MCWMEDLAAFRQYLPNLQHMPFLFGPSQHPFVLRMSVILCNLSQHSTLLRVAIDRVLRF